MIDLPTHKEMAAPHHRRALWALIAAGVLLVGILLAYYANNYQENMSQSAPPRTSTVAGQAVPPANLSNAEAQKLQTLVGKPVPAAKLTPAQLEALKKLQGN